jgi:dephospho-CoA kinase
MLRVALTGGIGTGKTYVLGRFRALGVPAIDADQLARAALAPGTSASAETIARFGPAVLAADGTIDRRRLGEVVFADPEARRDLEAIVHPIVVASIERWLSECDRGGRCAWALADVPLLYEAGLAARFDLVIVASCQPAEQLRRIMARDSLTEAEARARVASQIPIAEKSRRAHFVVHTDGTPADTDRQVADIYSRIGPV